MALAAGKLRHRVTIQEQVETRDSSGDVLIEWEDFAVVWAAVEPLSVREFISAQSMQSQIVARITVRYRDDLTATMRILHRDSVYNPQGWLPDPESGLEYLTAPCSAGVNDGR
jgi:SPP1 family predicted phage head-tail adaptor